MKPVYKTFVEKSLEHAAKEAASIAVGNSTMTNGKLKNS